MINSFRGKNNFLSNYHRDKITYNGQVYKSAEHAFQAAKCVNEFDRNNIQAALTPGRAKKLGNEVRLKQNWDLEKKEIMETILRNKFENPELRERLIKTDGYQLIEGNTWHDTYWGVCSCAKHQSTGKNVLGELLTKIRDEVKS